VYNGKHASLLDYFVYQCTYILFSGPKIEITIFNRRKQKKIERYKIHPFTLQYDICMRRKQRFVTC
jgi:hypothetical protein